MIETEVIAKVFSLANGNTEGLLSVATISFSPVVVWPRSLLLWPRSIVKGHSPHYFTQRRPQLQICIVEERSSLYIHLCIVVSVVV